MAKIETMLRELANERHPESGMIHRRVALRIGAKTHDVMTVYLRFQDMLGMISELKDEIEILRAERDSLRMSNVLLSNGNRSRNPLPTRMEWAKADHDSLLRMNFIGADEMTVGDYHTLMGKG